MEVDFIINADIQLILIPKNTMEEELLKQLIKQDNILTEIRTAVPLINKTIQKGIMIGKRTNKKEEEDKIDDQKSKENADK